MQKKYKHLKQFIRYNSQSAAEKIIEISFEAVILGQKETV